ncbi:hypothetical protein IPA_03320 [Ignicoccus pacificus DSM 13166]|uniref:Cytochrome C biogenesis protein transmembrane domain-containing protein n=1 Tax=Ignicoccus pacificus DSM 13166 TaxID=940294 RepID=A0A977KAW3_9CREN|nr:hypothetical protein IPA_03320 [Ignicoccus pacificus DSM 13166]
MPIACSNATVVGLSIPIIMLNMTSYSNFTLYLLGIHNGPPCLHLKAFLGNLSSQYNFTLVWIPVDLNHTKLLNVATKYLEEAGLIPGVPITLVYCKSKLVAVVEGAVLDTKFWLNVMNCSSKGVKVYYGNQLVDIITSNVTSKAPPPKIVPIIIAALTDSLNPVGLSIYGLLMILCVNVRKRCYKEALAFLVAYTGAHMALGGVLSTLGASKIYSVIGMGAASFMIVASLKPTEKLKKAASFAAQKLSRAVLKKSSVFLVGAAASTISMSPCVVGAYLSAMGMISSLPPELRLPVLALYALIYSTPVILLTILIHKGKKFVETRTLILILASISLILSVYTFITS